MCAESGNGVFEPVPTVVPWWQISNTCLDDVQNGDELGIDCGGSCNRCVRYIDIVVSLQLLCDVHWHFPPTQL